MPSGLLSTHTFIGHPIGKQESQFWRQESRKPTPLGVPDTPASIGNLLADTPIRQGNHHQAEKQNEHA